MGKVTIETLRALVIATNSLRFNQTIDPDTADSYERLLVSLRDTLVKESEQDGL